MRKYGIQVNIAKKIRSSFRFTFSANFRKNLVRPELSIYNFGLIFRQPIDKRILKTVTLSIGGVAIHFLFLSITNV